MGRDKATIVVGGASLAERCAAVLRAVAKPVLTIGGEAGTGLEDVGDPREGPLVALDAGMRALMRAGHDGPVFVLACDMPLVTAGMLHALADHRRGADAVVPIADGRLQPLCAVYGASARDVIARCVESGARSMRDALAAMRIEIVPAEALGEPQAFTDLDTPQDVERVSAILEAPA